MFYLDTDVGKKIRTETSIMKRFDRAFTHRGMFEIVSNIYDRAFL